MIEFIGRTGNVYRKNPFGGKKYAYACYKKYTDDSLRMSDYIGHITAEEALKDFGETVKDKKWKFEITIGNRSKTFIANLDGEILEPEEYKGKDFSNYYYSLVKKHGKENVKKIQQQI